MINQDAYYKDKRKYPRLATQLNVRYRLLDDPKSPFIKEITNSIGQGGLFIRTKNGFQKETNVQLEVSLKGRLILASGIVRHLIPYDSQAGGVQFPGIGIQFSIISPDDQEFIGKYVDNELKKQLKSY